METLIIALSHLQCEPLVTLLQYNQFSCLSTVACNLLPSRFVLPCYARQSLATIQTIQATQLCVNRSANHMHTMHMHCMCCELSTTCILANSCLHVSLLLVCVYRAEYISCSAVRICNNGSHIARTTYLYALAVLLCLFFVVLCSAMLTQRTYIALHRKNHANTSLWEMLDNVLHRHVMVGRSCTWNIRGTTLEVS